MATRCVNLNDDKRITQVSPIAIFVFVGCLVIESALMDFGILYLIVLAISYFVCHALFYYSPRFIFLSVKFYLKYALLSPTLEDNDYLFEERNILNLQPILARTSRERKF